MKNEDLFEAIIQEGIDAGTVPANEAADKLADMLTAMNDRIDAKFNQLTQRIDEITSKEGRKNEQNTFNGADMHGRGKEEIGRPEDREVSSCGGPDQ